MKVLAWKKGDTYFSLLFLNESAFLETRRIKLIWYNTMPKPRNRFVVTSPIVSIGDVKRLRADKQSLQIRFCTSELTTEYTIDVMIVEVAAMRSWMYADAEGYWLIGYTTIAGFRFDIELRVESDLDISSRKGVLIFGGLRISSLSNTPEPGSKDYKNVRAITSPPHDIAFDTVQGLHADGRSVPIMFRDSGSDEYHSINVLVNRIVHMSEWDRDMDQGGVRQGYWLFGQVIIDGIPLGCECWMGSSLRAGMKGLLVFGSNECPTPPRGIRTS